MLLEAGSEPKWSFSAHQLYRRYGNIATSHRSMATLRQPIMVYLQSWNTDLASKMLINVLDDDDLFKSIHKFK